MRFVVCGEALIDLIPEQFVSAAESHWKALSGGGPMNTAVALARLGCDSHFLGRLSTDSFGRQLSEHVRSSGVQLDLAISTQAPTTLAVVSLDEQGKASYGFHTQGTSNVLWSPDEFPNLTDEDWLHLGSLGVILEPGATNLVRFAEQTPATLSYDINVRPAVLSDRAAYFERVQEVMAAVGGSGGIVKASDEDIAWLVEDDSDPLSYAQAWAEQFGLALFVVTLGADGAAAVLADGRTIVVGGRSIEVADTVGAGDTFMAGFLSAYVANPADLEGALSRGIAAAAIVCTRIGAQPPSAAEVDELLAAG